MIYTSDHGQNLHERGDPGLSTHCSVDPLQEEGVVPLVVIDGNRDLSIDWRSEEHTSELQSLMRDSYAVFCLKKKSTADTHTEIRMTSHKKKTETRHGRTTPVTTAITN